jgi:hypothetical protein
VARDRAYLNSLVLPRFGTTPLAAITQPDVQAWVAQLTARGFAPATVVKAYQLLGRTLTAAVNADMIPRSPCRAVRLPKVEVHGQLYTGPPKTRAGRRTIGLPRVVVEELVAHLGPVGPGRRVRVHRREGRRASHLELPHQGVLPAVRAAGPAPLRPHDLRHTAVALWIAGGANPRRSASGPGTLPSASRWTATATCSRVTTPSCATAWTPCTLKGCRAR